MKDDRTFADRLAPDCVVRLIRAAQQRFATAEMLIVKRPLEAIYFYGFSAEMCLAAAYFRHAGFGPFSPIDRDTRQLRMAKARQLKTSSGQPLMSSDPHPLVGWARFLEWGRTSDVDLPAEENRRLQQAINKAIIIDRYWRPELRYKLFEYTEAQVDKVRFAARWLIDNQELL